MTGPTSPPLNGMSVTTDRLLRDLPSPDMSIDLVDIADRRGLTGVGHLDVANVMQAVAAGCRFLRRLLIGRPDVVYVPIAQNLLGFLRDALFLLPARLVRVPTVVHLHGCAFADFYETSSRLMRWLLRLCLSRVRAAIVLGPSAVGQFDGIVSRDRIRIIPNGVPDPVDRSEVGQLSEVARREPKVLYLSSLTMGKGFADVLRAIPLLSDVEGVRYVFAGEYTSPVASQTGEELITELDIRDRVEMLGPVNAERARAELRTARVFVMPPTQIEGQPLTILEAFASGTPVVTTRKGCIVDTVIDGDTGLYVEPGDSQAIAAALRLLLVDEERWTRLSVAGRQAYERLYRVERWVQDVRSVLREAADSL